jgi:hypothetical protein
MAKATINPVLDPRGKQERPMLLLAPRVSMDALRKGPVLFYDNTKLGFVNYMEVFKRIKENFSKEGITNFVDFRETPRGKTNQELKEYARKLAQAKPVAAILALGDVGVSPATTIITIGFAFAHSICTRGPRSKKSTKWSTPECPPSTMLSPCHQIESVRGRS